MKIINMDTSKQKAFDLKEEKYTLLNASINDVNTLIKFGAGKDAAETALEQLNECIEGYKNAQVEYLSMLKDKPDEDKAKAETADVEQKVDKVRTAVGNYLHALDEKQGSNEQMGTPSNKNGPPKSDNGDPHSDKSPPKSNTAPPKHDSGIQKNDNGHDKDNKDDKVLPADSISQVGSHQSGSSSVIRAKAAAKRAALEARMKKMELKHHLDLEEQRLKMKKEKFALDMELAEAAAEENAIQSALHEDGDIGGQAGDIIEDRSGKDLQDNTSQLSKQQSDFCEQQRELIHLLQAPKLDIPIFNGDPLKYYVFMRAFDANVESKISDNGARLTQLIQHCTGPALTVVQGCAIMEPDKGYPAAKSLIKDRFGNPLVIAQAWIEHVTKCDQIKDDDGPAIQEYSDLLRTCFHTLSAIGSLAEISAQTTLKLIIDILPANTASRWRRQVVHVKRTHARLPKFEDIVVFAEGLAEETNVPMYSSTKPKKSQKGDERKHNKSASYSTSADNSSGSNEKKCAMCQGSHMIYECSQFKEMSPDDRFKFVKSKHLCFNCLSGARHSSRDCKSKRRCRIDNCGRKHSYLLHGSNNNNSSSKPPTSSDSPSSSNAMSNDNEKFSAFVDTSCFMGASQDKIALPIVAVRVHCKMGYKNVDTYALLDNGSSHTFCSQELIDELGITGRQDTLNLTTLEKKDSLSSCQVVSQLEISDLSGTNHVKLPVVYTRPCLPINPENVACQADVSGLPHLEGVKLPLAAPKQVKLLIGQDNPDLLVPMNVIRGERGQPWASQTMFGWTLNGPVKAKVKGRKENTVTANFVNVNNDQLMGAVEKFWKIDGAGLYDDDLGLSTNDKKVLKMWDDTSLKVNGHYEIKIPFKNEDEKLPHNRAMAEKRFKQLEQKLEKKPDLKKQYIDAIEDLLKKGHAKEVPNDAIDRSDGRVWYLPHFGVVNPNKPRIRVVFDAAAKFGGYSLNDKVLQGPDLTNKLIGVLIRFRMRLYCVMADIQSMFYQVMVPDDQQDVLRFLWRMDESQPLMEYRLTRHVFGGTWSPSAANYALNKVIEDHGNNLNPSSKEAAKKGFYVDDLLVSVNSKTEAVQLGKELKALLACGGFNITKWVSNISEVMDEVPESDRSTKLQHSFDEPMAERALGVIWDITNDTFGYNIQIKEKPLTKRGVLATLSSVYDPLGLATAVILKARLIVQELFKMRVGWDERLPKEQLEKWERWLAELPNMEKLKVARCIKPQDVNGRIVRRELHHFSDASEVAYGVCSYVRQEDEKGIITVSLLMAKSRLAPLKKLTIPRLELTAATLAVKQNELIMKEIDETIDEVHFWTDSMIVLGYIGNDDKRFKTFVANRLAVIKEASSKKQWHHVESALNPADIASRGAGAEELSQSSLWFNGPHFLAKSSCDWPSGDMIADLDEDDPEMKKEAKVFVVKVKGESPTDRLMNSFSNWQRLKKAVSWMWLLRKLLVHDEGAVSVPYLEAQHMKEGERVILQYIQRKAFDEDVLEGGVISKSLVKLQPRMMNGLLCVGGRLKQSPHLEDESKHPVILPHDSPVVAVIVRYIHEKHGHAGREYVLAESRRNYWIVRGRSVIRRVINNCIICKKREPVVCQQQMADLPPDRVSAGGVFQHIGIDMYGPIMVKRGRARAKRYGCLITCLATRAIHVEIAHSLDTDSFIQCLQRFIARRGRPSLIRCDQGRNFIGAERELREELEALNGKKIQDFMNEEGIEWKFNPPYASMAGGIWERMIRSIRRVIAGICSEQVLTDEGLLTITAMAESIVNNRPITPNSADANDMNALSPNHFLIMKPVKDIPGIFDQECLRKHWRQLQYLANVLWKRWLREYLPQLQQRSKWELEKRDLCVGDLVLVMDYAMSKNNWIMGRVLGVNSGSDGKVRSVQVQLPNSVVSRPIAKISLLEANDLQVDKDYQMSHPSEE